MQPSWSSLCHPGLVYAPKRSILFHPWMVHANVVVYSLLSWLIYATVAVKFLPSCAGLCTEAVYSIPSLGELCYRRGLLSAGMVYAIVLICSLVASFSTQFRQRHDVRSARGLNQNTRYCWTFSVLGLLSSAVLVPVDQRVEKFTQVLV